MRPKRRDTTGPSELLWERPDRTIHMKRALVRLAEEIDWD